MRVEATGFKICFCHPKNSKDMQKCFCCCAFTILMPADSASRHGGSASSSIVEAAEDCSGLQQWSWRQRCCSVSCSGTVRQMFSQDGFESAIRD